MAPSHTTNCMCSSTTTTTTTLTLTLLLYAGALLPQIGAFNYSPSPNFIIEAPKNLKFFKPQLRSSYFGFSVLMRPTSIIVGAPRAQSTLPSQRNVNETGAIYRCSLTDATCYPYVFDDQGNRNMEMSEYTYDSEKRDYQWLGGAMDGGTRDTDKLLVCAPRFIAPAPNDYLMHGVCYWINDTLTKDPFEVRKISPLRLKSDQIQERNGQRFYFYMLAEQGLSAHVAANNEDFLIGAPGIHTWKGSVIRYRKKYLTDEPTLSRRDTEGSRVTRQSDEPAKVTYESEVLNPELWGQPNDSYFGYSVGTGYFDSTDTKKLMYVATAPQANEQSGEAYLFDIAGKTILKSYVFRGTQFGEYFGYSVLTEDLNGDGLTDVVVSAPQYSISGSYDDGAIYVFINQGRFNFERKLLTSPVHGKARFGNTLSALGDINHDGYNDIAVGAPFAGDGAVFIYLGGEKGLRDLHSQRLDWPKSAPKSTYGEPMFGHGLSKGADYDRNGFNDLAIGAPNAETVFVYRAYPVVRIIATINSQTREIKPDQGRFQVSVCYGIITTSDKVQTQDLAMRVVVDPQVKRVRITQTQSNELNFNVTAGTQSQCRVLDCEVSYSAADIFKPIELELHYDILHGIPDSAVFCDTCAAVDPAEPKVYSEKIIFSTGCASDICIADLQVKTRDLSNTYILGSSRTLSITYDVTNNGETAYLPQINMTSSNRMPFAKIPSNCKTNNNAVLLCDLNRNQPMTKGATDTVTVIYDVSGISGKSMVLTAEVFSTGKERTPDNNIIKDVITLTEFTEVEAIGVPVTPHINLEQVSGITEIRNNYEIKSHGPSTVSELEVVFTIPLSYKVSGSSARIPIVDINNISMQAVYDTQLIGIDFYQNNTQLLLNTFEISSSSSGFTRISKGSSHGVQYDGVKAGHVNELGVEHSLSDSVMTASVSGRRQRRAISEAHTATKEQYARIAHPKAYDLLNEDLKDTLPINRTIVFNCQDAETTECVRAVLRVYNYKPDKPITVTMKYQADLNEVNQILIDPWEFFVILVGLDVHKVGDKDGSGLALSKRIEYNIISKHQLQKGVPIWVIILAVLGGLLLLAAMTYGMYKAGFFKRAKKEEMDKLVNQNQASAEGDPTETENLNADSN